jgi:hypothetical protein
MWCGIPQPGTIKTSPKPSQNCWKLPNDLSA